MDANESLGLRSVSTEELRTLLKMVHSGQIACPVTPAQLAPLKFQHHSMHSRDHESAKTQMMTANPTQTVSDAGERPLVHVESQILRQVSSVQHHSGQMTADDPHDGVRRPNRSEFLPSIRKTSRLLIDNAKPENPFVTD